MGDFVFFCFEAWRNVSIIPANFSVCILRVKGGPSRDPLVVFPGQRHWEPISNMAYHITLRRMARIDVAPYGFRSTFRDWAAERTDFQNEVAEAANTHVVSNQAEASYRRGDLFEKRRALMEAWGNLGE